MPDPIVTRLPETQRALENKYSNNPDLLTGYDTPIAQAIYNLDLQRVNRGQNPLSKRQTQLALLASQTNQAVTKPPDRGLWGNVVNDFYELTSSVPRLPLAMYRELQQIPDIGEAISKASDQHGLLNQISGIAKAPGIRLIPGSFVAGNLNHPGELLKHPLFTALDLLPIAQKAGITGKAAEIAKPKLSPIVKAAGSTKTGQFFKAAFGTEARDLSQMMNKYDTALTDAAGNERSWHDLTNDPEFNAVARATREGYEIRKRYPSISEDRRMEITRLIKEDPVEIRNLSGDELAFVTDLRTAIDEIGRYGVSNQEMLDMIDGEIYDKDTASRILRTRRRANVAGAYGDVRSSIENPTPSVGVLDTATNPKIISRLNFEMNTSGHIILSRFAEEGIPHNYLFDKVDGGISPSSTLMEFGDKIERVLKNIIDETKDSGKFLDDDLNFNASNLLDSVQKLRSVGGNPVGEIVSKIEDITHNQTIRPKDKIKVIEGYGHALDAAGYDASPILDRIRSIRNTKSAIKYSDEDFRTYLAGVTDRIVPRPTVDITGFTETLKKIAKTDPQSRLLLDHIQKGRWSEAKVVAGNLSRRGKYAIPDLEPIVDEIVRQRDRARYLKSTQNYHPKAVAKAQRVAENTIRTSPPARFQEYIDKQVQRGLLEKYSTDPDFDKILPLLKEKNYSFLAKEGLIPEAEVRQLTLQMRKTWQEMKRDGIDPVFVHRVSEGQIGSIKFPKVLERIPRPSQTVKRSWNLTPTIDDATVALTHQGLEWLARRGSEEFIDEMMTKWGRTQDELMEQYLPAARKSAKTPDDVLQVANRLFKKEWQKYDPKTVINWPSARIKRWGGQEVWVPKTIAENIQRMHTPPGGRLTSVVDPIMNVFRTSLLPLAPRWHVYNVLGGGINMVAETGPGVFKFLKEATEMAKNGDMPREIPRGIGTMSRDVVEYDTKGSITKPLEDIFHHKGGQTLRRVWDEIQNARDKFGNVIEKSYSWNGFVDDTYRSMAYLYGKDKALTKGMTAEAAQKAGIELARKTFQQWDRMTPLERSIMRFVFPFYGWTAHIMQFVMRYPFDHPTRTAIVGSFARNEVEDMGTGLPEKFLNMFFLGDMDKNGNVKAFNLGGMNPFRDVANNLTFSGFIGQTNPLITTAFEALGVDTSTGGPELFPNMQYDAETGRLAFKSRNPLSLLAENILPQSRILLGFADSSSEFQQLLRTNPDSAQRLLMSQAGLPIIFRNVNVPQEIAKREIATDEAQSTALNQSLASGNWDAANKFPNLRPILAALKQMQDAGQLQSFAPQSQGQSAIALAQGALATIFAPAPPPAGSENLPQRVSR